MEAHITIKGRVQGVFFRAKGQEQAQKLGLTGWIKNEADGTVSAWAQGPKETIETFIEWCKHGPPEAHVVAVDVEWFQEPAKVFTSFDILHA